MTGTDALGSSSFLRYWRATAVSGLGTYVTLFALVGAIVDGRRRLPLMVGTDAWGIRTFLLVAVGTFAMVAVGLASTSFRTVRAPA